MTGPKVSIAHRFHCNYYHMLYLIVVHLDVHNFGCEFKEWFIQHTALADEYHTCITLAEKFL